MCSSRRFQWYPTTYICWAMTKPLLWIKLILSHSKGWVGLNTYRLRGIIGIVLMSTFLIHAYFLQSRHFAKPRLFSREISTVNNIKLQNLIDEGLEIKPTRLMMPLNCKKAKEENWASDQTWFMPAELKKKLKSVRGSWRREGRLIRHKLQVSKKTSQVSKVK